MRLPLLGLVVLFGCGCAARPAPRGVVVQPPTTGARPGPLTRAPDSAASTPTPEAEPLLEPCAVDSSAHAAAKSEVDALDRAISALRTQDELADVREQIAALNESPCLAIGGQLELPDATTSPFGLRHYWQNGARAYVEGYLDLAQTSGFGPFLYATPTFRTTLSREHDPGHPLAPLLCSETDAACIAETTGFRHRATQHFVLDAERLRLEGWKMETRSARDARLPADFDECAAKAVAPRETGRSRESPAASPSAPRTPEQFVAWLNCLEEHVTTVLDFPLVGIRQPTRGWLVVSGFRAARDACDERRLYDLATGSSFVVGRCSAPSSHSASDPRPPAPHLVVRTQVGTIPPNLLQELTWYLLLAPELEPVRQILGNMPPRELPRRAPAGGLTGAGWMVSGDCVSSDDSTLDWSYVLDGRPLATGTLRWPGCDGEPVEKRYARDLLEITESQLAPRCPVAKPPRSLALGGVSPDLDRIWSGLLQAPCAPR